MHVLRSLAAIVAAAAALGVPQAPAATLSTSSHTEIIGRDGETAISYTTTFTAAPGERNDVTARIEAGGFVVADAGGAPLIAGDGCAAQLDGSVRCAFSPRGETFAVQLGDGDDRVTLAPPPAGMTWPPANLGGGDGDDILDASDAGAPSVGFDGGAGDDVELGGRGDDGFVGDPGHDTISGGPGSDSVGYGQRTAGVRASLDAPRPGDEDALSSIETLIGGHGDDRLIGSDGDDVIDGGDGSDVVDGRGGDDDLSNYGGTTPNGAAVIRGGAGDDRVDLGLGVVARVEGGPGADDIDSYSHARIAGGPGRDRLTGGYVIADDDGATGDFVTCTTDRGTRAVLGAGDVSSRCGTRLRRTGGRPGLIAIDRNVPIGTVDDEGTRLIGMTIWCADEAPAAGCPVRVAIREASGRTVARRAVTLRRGGARPTALRYDEAFHRRLVAARAMRVAVVATVRGPHGRVVTDRYNYCLQATPRPTDRMVACR
jgi:hypothetical protein